MAERQLRDQTAIVTGSAKRVGRAIALALAEAGANVVVNYYRSEAEAEGTVCELEQKGVRAVAVRADVSQAAEAKKLIETAQRIFERVDILVNNAGVFARTRLEETTAEQWDWFMAVNLRAQFLCAQAVAPIMRAQGGGKIVNLASLGGLLAWPGFIAYCVSKAGVIHLTRCLARALGPEIQVNCICPGTIRFPGEEPDENFIRRAALHRMGLAEDIARTVLFLVTQAEFITGQALVVDGGYALA